MQTFLHTDSRLRAVVCELSPANNAIDCASGRHASIFRILSLSHGHKYLLLLCLLHHTYILSSQSLPSLLPIPPLPSDQASPSELPSCVLRLRWWPPVFDTSSAPNMGKDRNREGGKTRLAEEINDQYKYDILYRMPKCVPSTRPVGNGRNDRHAPAGGFNKDNIGMARYFMCRACGKKQNVSGYLKLAEQLTLPTLAAFARNVLQNHTSDLPDVSQLNKLVREYERRPPQSASTFTPAALATSSRVSGRAASSLSNLASTSFQLPAVSGSQLDPNSASLSNNVAPNREPELATQTSVAALGASSFAPVPQYAPDQINISSSADSDSDLDSLPDATTRKRKAEPASDNDNEDDEPLPKRRSDGAATNGDTANAFWTEVSAIMTALRSGLDRLTEMTKANMSATCAPPAATSAMEALRSSAAESVATVATPATTAEPVVASSSAVPPQGPLDASPESLHIRSLAHRFNVATDKKARKRIIDEVYSLNLRGEGKSRFFAEVLQGNPAVLDLRNRFRRANNKFELGDLWREARQLDIGGSFFDDLFLPKKRPLTTVDNSVAWSPMSNAHVFFALFHQKS